MSSVEHGYSEIGKGIPLSPFLQAEAGQLDLLSEPRTVVHSLDPDTVKLELDPSPEAQS